MIKPELGHNLQIGLYHKGATFGINFLLNKSSVYFKSNPKSHKEYD